MAPTNSVNFSPITGTVSALVCCGCIAVAYSQLGGWPLILVVFTLAVGFFFRPQREQLCETDAAMVLIVVLETASLLPSRYAHNGVSSVKLTVSSVLYYAVVRIVAHGMGQLSAISLTVTTGGVGLAWFALTQFSRSFYELQANGLSSAVAFRYRLISPPSSWVLGEWFTLVLMTLPFAFALPVFLWVTRRPKLAAMSLLLTAAIAAALTLSCSRAVFWSVAFFFVAVFTVVSFYRICPIKAAGIGAASALFALAVLVLAENAFFPGVLDAYTGGHTSQARSTEGRLAIWKRSIDAFKASPLWGVGSGNAPLYLAASADDDETTGFASRTFSLPIQLLTEKGIIGTALYLAVLLLAMREGHRKLRNPKVSPQMKGMTCCMVAGIISVLFRELTYSSLLEHAATAMLFAMMLALMVNEEAA
jgi:O-antigen ligase